MIDKILVWSSHARSGQSRCQTSILSASNVIYDSIQFMCFYKQQSAVLVTTSNARAVELVIAEETKDQGIAIAGVDRRSYAARITKTSECVKPS